MTDDARRAITRLAQRLVAGEAVLSDLYAEALLRLDDALDEIAPAERTFLDEIRFSVPAAEEGSPQARATALRRILAAAETFTGGGRAPSSRSTVKTSPRRRRTTP